ncbi:MAG: UPF0104 family protein [Thermoplasmata archaeon]|nr:MAG: UPF0104 family protein [Thermoplasmata archaeon]
MNNKFFKKAKKFLPFIGIIIFIYTIYALDISDIIDAVLSINPLFLLLAIPLTIPRVLIRNYAWKLIMDEQNIQISYWNLLSIFLMGYFYGTITPGYLGQLMRIPYLKEKTNEPYGKLFFNSSIETIVHTTTLYLMMFIGALIVLGSFPQLLTITVSWVIILSVVLLIFIRKNRGEIIFKKLIHIFIPKSLKIYFQDFAKSFYTDFPRIKKLLLPAFLGLFTWIIIYSQYYLIIMALNLPIPYLYFLLLFPVANLAALIPISFAGLGTRELIAVILFTTLFSVPDEKIFVVSLLGFIITDIVTGLIGLVIAFKESGKDMFNKNFISS